MAGINSNLAGMAAVAFEAVGVSEFVRDAGQAERAYRASTEHMSDGAIKLELATERLNRAIAKGPRAANSQKSALLAVRRAEAELAGQTTRTTATIDKQDRAIGRLGRSSHGALGGLARLRGGAIGLTASLLGGAGLAYALRSTLEAAKEQELVLGQTKLALEAAGISYEQYAGKIEKTIRAQSRLGFDDEALLKTFSTFVTRTKDVTEALKLNALATDVARGRYIDLEAASKIVLKASLGQSGQLRRLGIDVKNGASAYELLAKLTESYGGRAAGASSTATAAQDRLNVSLENAKEIIGSGLTPVVANLADRVSDYLDDAGRQEELQRKVNAVVKDGTAIIRGLARGLQAARAATSPLVDALGGMENAARLAFALFAASKLRGISLGLRGIGGSAAFAATQVNALALAEGRATAASSARFAGLAKTGGYLLAVNAALNASDPQSRSGIVEDAKSGKLGSAALKLLIGTDFGLGDIGTKKEVRGTPQMSGPGGPGGLIPKDTRGKDRKPPAAKGDGLSRLQRLQLASSAAVTPREQLAAARNEETYFRQIASNEKLRGDKLFQARSDLLAAQARRRSIEDQIAADRLADIEKTTAAREKANNARRRKAVAAAARLRAAEDKISAEISRVNTKSRANLVYDPATGFFESTKPGASKASKAGESGKGLTKADFTKLSFEFLQNLQGITNQYGSNFAGASAAPDSNGRVQVHLMREQNQMISTLVGRQRNPEAHYGRFEADSMMQGGV